LGNLNDILDINRDPESVKRKYKTSATDSLGHFVLKEHKPLFDEECSKLLEQRKQVKLQ